MSLHTIHEETAVIKRTQLPQLVADYRQAEATIREAFAAIAAARETLRASFGVADSSYSYSLDFEPEHGRHVDWKQPDCVLDELKKDAWRILVDRMELRRLLSIKRAADLDKALNNSKELPEVTVENVLGMVEANSDQAGQYLRESVLEVVNMLRPRNSKYVTNSQFEVPRKVILSGMVAPGYRNNFRVGTYRSQDFRALDNVFHSLAGAGAIKTYLGQLGDAIEASADGEGETDYFRFRCCKNGNLHLEFKRLDLLERLNSIAFGNTVRPPGADPRPNSSGFERTAAGFQDKICRLAAVAQMTAEGVFGMWKEYSRTCAGYDQSPVLGEFVEWFAPKLGGDKDLLRDAIA